MYIPRIYLKNALKKRKKIKLKYEITQRISKVLRMKKGENIELFDGSNFIFIGKISRIEKKTITVKIKNSKKKNKESKLYLHLGQILPKKNKMDLIIQKSVEIGINTITPIFSKNFNSKIDSNKKKKIYQRWKKIIISSCEQCGRNKIPSLRPIMSLKEWCAENDDSLKIIFTPKSHFNINKLPKFTKNIRLLIGPEYGILPCEKNIIKKYQFKQISLGPRILRTETATISAISILQFLFGDFNTEKNKE